MRFALHDLRWPPDAFWRATPRELAAALGPAHRPLGGDDLATLMRAFPDPQGASHG